MMHELTWPRNDVPELPRINVKDVRKTCQLLIPSTGCAAILAKGVRTSGMRKRFQQGGYFDTQGVDEVVRAATTVSGDCEAVYITLNELRVEHLARAHNRVDWSFGGAEDENVTRLRTMLIDLDVVTPLSGISTTEEEKQEGRRVAVAVRSFLTDRSFPEPVFADSGNGFHLLYRIDLDVEDVELLRQFLDQLADRFDSSKVRIDRTVFNAARYTKLYGTMACKGDDRPDRPHRLSRLLDVPSYWSRVHRFLLEAVFARAPKRVKSTPRAATTSTSNPDRRERATAYVRNCPGAVSGQGGQNRALFVACKVGPGFDLGMEEAVAILRDHWNPAVVRRGRRKN